MLKLDYRIKDVRCQGMHTSSKGIIIVKRHAVMTKAREELRLHCTMDGVVNSLIHGRLDPPIPITDLAYLCHFPGHVVADGKFLEVAFAVELVNFSKRHLIRRGAIRSMEVPHINVIRL